MEHIFCFEELDQMIGDYAPFLVSLSDGIEGELRMLISAAGVGETEEIYPILKELITLFNTHSMEFWQIQDHWS